VFPHLSIASSDEISQSECEIFGAVARFYANQEGGTRSPASQLFTQIIQVKLAHRCAVDGNDDVSKLQACPLGRGRSCTVRAMCLGASSLPSTNAS